MTTMPSTSRRGFLIGIGAALAAPAIVKAESLMKIAMLREGGVERTAIEALNSLIGDHWHHYVSQQYTLGFRVILSEITSEGLRIEDILAEDFYGQPS